MSNVYIYDRRCGFLDGVSRTTDMGRGETTSPAVFSELRNALLVCSSTEPKPFGLCTAAFPAGAEYLEPFCSVLSEPTFSYSGPAYLNPMGASALPRALYTVPSFRAQPAQSCRKNSKSLLAQFQLARATNR